MFKVIAKSIVAVVVAMPLQAGNYESLFACYRAAAINHVHSLDRSVSTAYIAEMFDANVNGIADDFRFLTVHTIEAIDDGNPRISLAEVLRANFPNPGPFIDCMMAY